MNWIRIVYVVAVLLVANPACGSRTLRNHMKPSQWLSSSQLEQTPSVDEITLQSLENLSVEEGAKLIERIYHLSQINQDLKPNYIPSPGTVPSYIVKPNGNKITTTLDKLASIYKQQPHFGHDEITVFITGLPTTTETVKNANRQLINSYLQRYNMIKPQPQQFNHNDEKMHRTSSEEDEDEVQRHQPARGNFVVIDLGSQLTSFKHIAFLDIDHTGVMIASAMMELLEKSYASHETIHVLAQGIAAHVAGAAGNEYTRRTGHQLRRITALDPSKILAKHNNTLMGLSRGDAAFVDAIHTNVYGIGTITRVGDVDFYPNGPTAAVPGADNIIEASMRATRYFAESVRPGNEHNFPATAAKSLQQYRNTTVHGKRIYMGIDTDYDREGDYILEVNAHSPFGKRVPVRKQNSHRDIHYSSE